MQYKANIQLQWKVFDGAHIVASEITINVQHLKFDTKKCIFTHIHVKLFLFLIWYLPVWVTKWRQCFREDPSFLESQLSCGSETSSPAPVKVHHAKEVVSGQCRDGAFRASNTPFFSFFLRNSPPLLLVTWAPYTKCATPARPTISKHLEHETRGPQCFPSRLSFFFFLATQNVAKISCEPSQPVGLRFSKSYRVSLGKQMLFTTGLEISTLINCTRVFGNCPTLRRWAHGAYECPGPGGYALRRTPIMPTRFLDQIPTEDQK